MEQSLDFLAILICQSAMQRTKVTICWPKHHCWQFPGTATDTKTALDTSQKLFHGILSLLKQFSGNFSVSRILHDLQSTVYVQFALYKFHNKKPQ